MVWTDTQGNQLIFNLFVIKLAMMDLFLSNYMKSTSNWLSVVGCRLLVFGKLLIHYLRLKTKVLLIFCKIKKIRRIKSNIK